MVNEFEIKKQLCDIGKRIYNRNMVAANDGNFSVKIAENEYLCTPTGVSKGFMTPEFICKVDGKGNVIQANPGFKPSSEIKMHMRVYEKRPDVSLLDVFRSLSTVHLPQWRFRITLRNTFHISMQYFLRTTEHLHGAQTLTLHT